MDLRDRFKELLNQIGTNYVSSTAYDTAWVARLVQYAPEISNRAMAWLTDHQLPDGSWGVAYPTYYHDRIVCTLAAMIALSERGRRTQDSLQVKKGLLALEQITSNATKELMEETNAATVGFELIAPTLVSDAEKLGIIKSQGERILGRLGRLRKAKMEKLSGKKISKFITAAHSAELAGKDNLDLLDIENLQEENGSVANSPSATAYFALHVKPGNPEAISYLKNIMGNNGGVPSFAPFDVFERTWILWNLLLTKKYCDSEIQDLCKPHIDYLQEKWRPEHGLGFSAEYTLTDGDDTMVGYEVLSKVGRKPDFQSVLNYEEESWFRCYHLETERSIDVNIHVLGALRQAGVEPNHPTVEKAINFIRATRLPEGYWHDKWHVSPYYTTAHAIILSKGYDDKLCSESVAWILGNQRPDGSWGFYSLATAEETAYCLQALIIWKRHGGKIPTGCIERASYWLANNYLTPRHPLWIDKSLYCPDLLVEASILSALTLAEEEDAL